MVPFFLCFSIFAFGDYLLYYVSNMGHELVMRHILATPQNKVNMKALSFSYWVMGNSISYVFLYFIVTQNIGYMYWMSDADTWLHTLATMFSCLFVQDTLFYAMHRTAHIPVIYRKIHYVHHTYHKPNSWVGRYSHWLDSNMENISFMAPALLFPMSIKVFFACLMFAYIWGNFIHSYAWKQKVFFMNDSVDHTLHHKYGMRNYNFAYYFNFWDDVRSAKVTQTC